MKMRRFLHDENYLKTVLAPLLRDLFLRSNIKNIIN